MKLEGRPREQKTDLEDRPRLAGERQTDDRLTRFADQVGEPMDDPGSH